MKRRTFRISATAIVIGTAVCIWAIAAAIGPSFTGVSIWPSSGGGFVRYTASDDAVSSIVVSSLPEEEVRINSHASWGMGVSSESLTICTGNGTTQEVALRRWPKAIVITKAGEITVRRWPIERPQFQGYIDRLEAAPVGKDGLVDSIGALRDFFAADPILTIPENVKDVLSL